jgi:type III pantothenate kinase
VTDNTPEQIPHVLACDVGNSAIKFAHVHGDTVSDVRSMRIGELADLGQALAELWAELPQPRKIVAASVNAPGLKALEAAAVEHLAGQHVIVIGRDIPRPIDTALPDPEAIGIDRLCAAVAAFDRLGVACVVVDLGTAITIDAVNSEGVFLGGAILPGLRMGAAALHEKTAQLPEVEPANPEWVFGRDTREAIIGGLVGAARGAIRHFIEAYATEMGHWPLVVATGGDAQLICGDVNESELVQAIVPDLAIRGVAMAYYRSLIR